MDIERRISVLETTLTRQLGWIAAADAKTGFIFAITIAMLGLLASTAPAYGEWSALGVLLAGGTATLLLACMGCVVAAVFPRTKGPRLSIIFFGGISSRDVDGFRTEFQCLSDEAYEEDLIQQCHINAVIAATKYRFVKAASLLLVTTVAPWLVAAYVLLRDKGT